ncbi:MAG: hypothetical protein KC736_00710 [Candidatus Moranbacteria bacterium]|nr:hypothetical protein [Candidatus Moranbacteria bacterium]
MGVESGTWTLLSGQHEGDWIVRAEGVDLSPMVFQHIRNELVLELGVVHLQSASFALPSGCAYTS